MLYHLVLFYVKIGLHLFYKKIEIEGLENIPKNAAVLFVANHQNAMMDPVLIGTHNSRVLYFLARASAFKSKILGKLLGQLNAMAIYRVRDGVDSKKLNEAVFDKCNLLLDNNKSILIFPEGSHSLVRKVRSLRAGFVRITFDYLAKNPTKEFYIIPIGLNYNNTFDYAKKVKIIYGKPILASAFYDENDINKSRSELIKETHQKLTELIVNIEDDDNYNSIIASLSEDEFLTPVKTNKKLKSSISKTQNLKPQTGKRKNVYYYLLMLNTILPFLIWKWLKPKIKSQEFISTAKFSLGLTLFPLTYFIQTLIVNHFFGIYYAISYIILCFLIVILTTKSR